jgi:hypothetical protein
VTSEGTRYFIFHFHHAQVTFGKIVGKRAPWDQKGKPRPRHSDREDVSRDFWVWIVSLFRACAVRLDWDGSDETQIVEKQHSDERIAL